MSKRAYVLGIVLIACFLCIEGHAVFYVDDFVTKSPWVDVRAHGAIANDGEDDTVSIQQAIDTIGSITDFSRGTIFFPPGVFCITSSLDFDYSRINVVGSGMHRTQIKAIGTWSDTEMLDFSGAVDGETTQLYWTKISDLCIEGPGRNSEVDGIKIGKMVSVDIRNVIVKNCEDALHVAHDGSGSRLALQSVVLTDCKRGAYLKNLKGVNVNGLTLKAEDGSGEEYGLYLEGVSDSVFNNVWIEGTDVDYGLYIDNSGQQDSVRNTFINCVFKGGEDAVWIYNTDSLHPMKGHIFIGCNFSGSIKNGYSSDCEAPAYLIQCSGISDTYYIYGDFRTSFGPAKVKNHTGSSTLKPIESNTYHTNKGASSSVTLTLPDVDTKGLKFTFAVLENEELRVDPGSGKIWGQSSDNYIYSTEVSASLTLVSDGSGNWMKVDLVGCWCEEGVSPCSSEVLEESANYTAGAVADGSFTYQDITVSGAAPGDYATASFTDISNLILDAQVTATDTVTCVFYNQTGGSVTPSGTLYVKVEK